MGNAIFISHKSSENDKEIARDFKQCLVYAGIPDESIFIAEELHPGEQWHPAILEALETSHVFYLLYTDPSEDESLTFQVEFVRRSDAIPVTDDLDRLYQYLIMARNFRSNVLQRYQQELHEGSQFDTKLLGFLDEIELVRIDLRSRGLDPEQDFTKLISTDIRHELFRLKQEWDEAEKLLRRMYEKSNFDHSEVDGIMEKLIHLNMVFSLIMCGALQGRLCLQ